MPEANAPYSDNDDAIVTGLDDLTHDIKLVRIAAVGGSPLLFTAGQYAQVGFDGVPARSYSMANRHADVFFTPEEQVAAAATE